MTITETAETIEPAALVNVANEPLINLMAAQPDSPVYRAIQRIQQNLADPNGVLSAFSSFIDGN